MPCSYLMDEDLSDDLWDDPDHELSYRFLGEMIQGDFIVATRAPASSATHFPHHINAWLARTR